MCSFDFATKFTESRKKKVNLTFIIQKEKKSYFFFNLVNRVANSPNKVASRMDARI